MTGHLQRRGPERTSTSPWAIVALICAVGVFCPPLSVAGVFLGWRALSDVKRRGGRGEALAKTAIVIGLIGIAAWLYIGWWANTNIRRVIIDGPGPAIAAAQAGSPGALVERFGLDPTAENLDAATNLATQLTSRYGPYVMIERAGGDLQREVNQDTRHRPIVAYFIIFKNQTVEAEAEIQIFSDAGAEYVGTINALHIYDPDQGDLTFPPGRALPERPEPIGAPATQPDD